MRNHFITDHHQIMTSSQKVVMYLCNIGYVHVGIDGAHGTDHVEGYEILMQKVLERDFSRDGIFKKLKFRDSVVDDGLKFKL